MGRAAEDAAAAAEVALADDDIPEAGPLVGGEGNSYARFGFVSWQHSSILWASMTKPEGALSTLGGIVNGLFTGEMMMHNGYIIMVDDVDNWPAGE